MEKDQKSGEKGLIHYELILLFSIGFQPKEVIRLGYSRGSAYRFYRIYRDARKRAVSRLTSRNSVSPAERSKANNQGVGRKKIGRPPHEKKPCLILNKETGEYEEKWL